MSICISLTVHENLAVIKNQLENLNKYFSNHFIIVHLSLMGATLFREVDILARQFENVYLNPIIFPTAWGWILHAHISNFLYAKEIGLPFTHFVCEASNTMYFRKVDVGYLSSSDFLCDLREVPPLHTKEIEESWGWVTRAYQDKEFLRLLEVERISRLYVGTHEGSVYSRELYEEILKVLIPHYQYKISEVQWDREEFYPPTIAKHLGAQEKRGLVYRDVDITIDLVSDLLKKSQDPSHAFVPFGIKRIHREIHDPVRVHITNL